ncbi:MAG: alanine racemase [Ignavibacteriales bacterium]|nr:alanine racemase [Ignavibacteriales bacterium]
MRPTKAIIRLSNLGHNYRELRKRVAPAKVAAVIKADAYGHGAVEAAQTLADLKTPPEYFAVAYAEEAKPLRKAGVKTPVLVFDLLSKDNLEEVVADNLEITVADERHLRLLSRAKLERRVAVHVNVDTGMGRVGTPYREAVAFIRKVAAARNVRLAGVYTHFATSDEKDKTFARLQTRRFKEIVDRLREEGVDYGVAHAANSGGVLDLPEATFDMVRLGISLYGYYPSLETSESVPLKPVMALESRVGSSRIYEKGETVSYGRLFMARRSTRIVSVPIGYADGVNRNLTHRMKAIIKGRIVPHVGRVTMDRIMFDVGDLDVRAGDRVVLIGEAGGKRIDAWDWSRALETIPYEITCAISKRVPRVYRR